MKVVFVKLCFQAGFGGMAAKRWSSLLPVPQPPTRSPAPQQRSGSLAKVFGELQTWVLGRESLPCVLEREAKIPSYKRLFCVSPPLSLRAPGAQTFMGAVSSFFGLCGTKTWLRTDVQYTYSYENAKQPASTGRECCVQIPLPLSCLVRLCQWFHAAARR